MNLGSKPSDLYPWMLTLHQAAFIVVIVFGEENFQHETIYRFVFFNLDTNS